MFKKSTHIDTKNRRTMHNNKTNGEHGCTKTQFKYRKNHAKQQNKQGTLTHKNTKNRGRIVQNNKISKKHSHI
jgi:hypothetical protein